ncbi:MAG: gamma carbonic anhydrase family protein [Candidatus Helarchaeota archaeon]
MKEPKLRTLVHKKISFAGKIPQTAPDCFIAPNCFLIGNVILKKNSSIWFGATLRGDTDLCQIGEGSAIMEQCYVENSIIGDQTMISHGAIIHKSQIGNSVLVGIGARIINGAKVGDNCLIGAGALILPNTEIPPNSIVIEKGKIIRKTTDNDLKYIQESVQEVQRKAKMLKEILQRQTG